MFLDPDTQEPIDPLLWHSLPDESVRFVHRYKIGSLIATLYRNPPSRSEESLVAIPYSLVVRREGRTILVISLEMEDLRALALRFGCSVRELQIEYHTKGNWGPLVAYLYTKEKREYLGPFIGELSFANAVSYLLEEALDTFDMVDDPLLLEGEDEGAGEVE
ncbi:MAG: hypothetical protein WC233_07370 [Sphaerochaeta sp.]|jgi:hypothetical protein